MDISAHASPGEGIGRAMLTLAASCNNQETLTMEMTIKKRIEVEGYGLVDGEFIENEQGWFCREVNGIRWNFRDWGAQAPMESPEEAALYLLSLNIDDSES